MESERPDAHFRDPFARRLAGERGEAITRAMKNGIRTSWPMVVRTAVMDEIILRLVREQAVDAVLNLAAGLDARPWRLDLPATLQWTDVDHAAMLDHKTATLAGETPRCRYEAVSLDLADHEARRALFHRVAAAASRVLVITEGLLIYLTSEAVTDLARDLHDEPAFAWWLTDLASPELLRWMQKSWGKSASAANAPFQFSAPDASVFFAPLGWTEVEWRSSFDDGIRLDRTFPLARFWRFLGRLAPAARKERMRRFAGNALLKRAP